MEIGHYLFLETVPTKGIKELQYLPSERQDHPSNLLSERMIEAQFIELCFIIKNTDSLRLK